MAGDGSQRKCFTFIWKLENASYCWQSYYEYIESPLFTVDEIEETNWKLELNPSVERNGIGFYLKMIDNKWIENVKIDVEFAFLSLDGTVLHAKEKKNSLIPFGEPMGYSNFASRNEVFLSRRSVFLPQDTLTVRCRIWKSVSEMSKNVQCFARTRIAVEKISFLWSIQNFSTLKLHEKKTFEIKSHGSIEKFMSLELLLTGGIIWDETIRFKIIPNYQTIKISTFQLSIVDASNNTVKCFRDEFWCGDPCDSKDFALFCTKNELLEKKSTFLPNDVLSFLCECTFSSGYSFQDIETTNFDCNTVGNSNWDKQNELPVPNCVLLDNLKSMLNNSCLSDVKLRTTHETYFAHKSILGASSPVFKAMFSNDMKEKIKECVDIEDLNDETVLRMLRYIYSAEVEEMEWTSATDLYEAADKYQILSLKDICSAYLKSNLCINKACELLVLADMHQDESMKIFVQDFIIRHGKEIINSEDWKQFMKTNLNLAAETMCLKFKE